MVGIREIRTRITSIQNIKKLTKSMEMVSASKMRQFKNKVIHSRSYNYIIQSMISRLSAAHLGCERSYFREYKVKRVGYIVVSTDRGLCGSLNINLFKKLLNDVMVWSDKGVSSNFIVIGSKGISFLKSKNANVILQIIDAENSFSLHEKLINPAKAMLKAYNESYLDKLYIVNNKFVDTLSQTPTIKQLLPFSSSGDDLERKNWDYLYESDWKVLLDSLIYRYIESQIYQGVIENLASEQAARMMTMKSATDNSGTLIKEFQLVYNKIRQTGITQELIEIISGTISGV